MILTFQILILLKEIIKSNIYNLKIKISLVFFKKILLSIEKKNLMLYENG